MRTYTWARASLPPLRRNSERDTSICRPIGVWDGDWGGDGGGPRGGAGEQNHGGKKETSRRRARKQGNRRVARLFLSALVRRPIACDTLVTPRLVN
jgi:hypothetical protein